MKKRKPRTTGYSMGYTGMGVIQGNFVRSSIAGLKMMGRVLANKCPACGSNPCKCKSSKDV